MKIMACFTIGHDIERLSLDALRGICAGGLDLTGRTRQFGNYDEAALETALVLAESSRRLGTPATTTALTVGSCEKRFIQRLFAVGFDHVVIASAYVSGSKVGPAGVAAAIAGFISAYAFDVILTGCQAGPLEHGQTPHILAAMLNMPCLCRVAGITPTSAGLAVTGKTDTGAYSCEIRTPCIYAMGDAEHSYLRAPTLRERVAVSARQPEYYNHAFTEATGPQPRFIRARCDEPEVHCEWIEADSTEEKAAILWERYLKEYTR